MRVIISMLWLTLASLAIFAQPTPQDSLVESYVARLSPNDHFNSRGQRLTKPAEIIRQDRANFHEFGKADSEDESDRFFANKANRETLQRLLQQGRTTSSAYNTIVNGNPLIRVDIYKSSRGLTFVDVTILRR